MTDTTDTTSEPRRSTITMDPKTQLFYKGVTAASKIEEQMRGPEWGEDYSVKLNAFWFYVGVAAGEEDALDKSDAEQLQTFMQGAGTRAPREPQYRYFNDQHRGLPWYWSEDGGWSEHRDEALHVPHSKRHEAPVQGDGVWQLVPLDEED